MTYDKVADTLILIAALEHFGEGFYYEITDYGIHILPYYEIKDTLFVYYDKYDNKYDTVDRYIAETPTFLANSSCVKPNFNLISLITLSTT